MRPRVRLTRRGRAAAGWAATIAGFGLWWALEAFATAVTGVPG